MSVQGSSGRTCLYRGFCFMCREGPEPSVDSGRGLPPLHPHPRPPQKTSLRVAGLQVLCLPCPLPVLCLSLKFPVNFSPSAGNQPGSVGFLFVANARCARLHALRHVFLASRKRPGEREGERGFPGTVDPLVHTRKRPGD